MQLKSLYANNEYYRTITGNVIKTNSLRDNHNVLSEQWLVANFL